MLVGVRGRPGRRAQALTGGLQLGEDAVAQLDRREKVRVRQQHLRAPEKQKAVAAVGMAIEREVEALQDVSLRLGVEVHQRVPAGEQIEPRDRRVLHQVVAAEDHRASQVGAEHVAPAARLEVAVAQRPVHAFHLLRRIAREARLAERFLVDIGGVDLDALAEGIHAYGLGEHDGERVGLLSRGAARRPNAHAVVAALRGEQARHDLLAQVVPRRRVAKEGGDVDQDGVEEVREFLGMHLEVVAVVAVVRHRQRLHAPLDAPHQARTLVAGEVEAALLLQELQQRLELRVVGFRHSVTGEANSRCSAGAISSTASTKSAAPVASAASGMPGNSAFFVSCTITVPPIFLIALTPIAPSWPLPESITAMARSR